MQQKSRFEWDLILSIRDLDFKGSTGSFSFLLRKRFHHYFEKVLSAAYLVNNDGIDSSRHLFFPFCPETFQFLHIVVCNHYILCRFKPVFRQN